MPKKRNKGLIKQPQTYDTPSYDQKRPIFSFHSIEKNYCLSKCTTNEKASLADRLHRLSRLTWAELKSAPRHGLGCEKIDHSAIKAAIPHSITPDVKFLSFRFYNKAPMVGYRDKEVFNIIWLDREYSLYEH